MCNCQNKTYKRHKRPYTFNMFESDVFEFVGRLSGWFLCAGVVSIMVGVVGVIVYELIKFIF